MRPAFALGEHAGDCRSAEERQARERRLAQGEHAAVRWVVADVAEGLDLGPIQALHDHVRGVERAQIDLQMRPAFVARFRAGPVHTDSPMPWRSFSTVSEQDARALYRYLRSLPASPGGPDPQKREVTVASGPTP